MRQIKFRGRDIETGEFVYADLGNIFVSTKGDKYYFGSEHAVSADDIEQLIGVDVHGNEIFEGDLVKELHERGGTEGRWTVAEFKHYAAIRDGGIVKVTRKEIFLDQVV